MSNIKEHGRDLETAYRFTKLEVWTNEREQSAFVEIDNDGNSSVAKFNKEQLTKLRDALSAAIAAL